MRFSLFGNKSSKIQAINDEEIGSPMEIASHANEDFPTGEDEMRVPVKTKSGRNFILKSFFKSSQPAALAGGSIAGSVAGSEKDGSVARRDSVRSHRMLGINTLITDSFYQDKEDEADEWRSQMDLFADAYETQSEAMNRPSLTPAADDIKTAKVVAWSDSAFANADGEKFQCGVCVGLTHDVETAVSGTDFRKTAPI